MQGSEGSRSAAKYQANRALFLMLLASAYRPDRAQRSRREPLATKPFLSQLNKAVQPARSTNGFMRSLRPARRPLAPT